LIREDWFERRAIAFRIQLFLLAEGRTGTLLGELGLILLSSHTWLWARKAKGKVSWVTLTASARGV
jgi:hypothetical protein